jgi:putative Mg2+ transporter-C (MgtC) family protein
VILQGGSPEVWTDLGRLAIASLLGSLIGLERRIQAQPAGIRTQMVVAASCCLAMVVSRHLPRLEGAGDPGRIAQSVLQGLGFIGAGAILKSGLSVHGLTTAATLWASATIGLAAGAGLLIEAAALTAIVGVGVLALEPLEVVLTRRRELRRITVESKETVDLLDQMRPILSRHHLRLDEVGGTHRFQERRHTLSLVVACPEAMSHHDLVREIGGLPGVIEVRVE